MLGRLPHGSWSSPEDAWRARVMEITFMNILVNKYIILKITVFNKGNQMVKKTKFILFVAKQTMTNPSEMVNLHFNKLLLQFIRDIV